jgi:hypothetical protein
VQTTPRRTGIHSFDSTGDNNEKRLTPKPFLALNAGLGNLYFAPSQCKTL